MACVFQRRRTKRTMTNYRRAGTLARRCNGPTNSRGHSQPSFVAKSDAANTPQAPHARCTGTASTTSSICCEAGRKSEAGQHVTGAQTRTKSNVSITRYRTTNITSPPTKTISVHTLTKPLQKRGTLGYQSLKVSEGLKVSEADPESPPFFKPHPSQNHMHLEDNECLGSEGIHEAGYDTDHHGALGLAGGTASRDTHEAGQEAVVGGPGAPDVFGELGENHRGHGTERPRYGGGHHRLRGNAGEADSESTVGMGRKSASAAGQKVRGGRRGTRMWNRP